MAYSYKYVVAGVGLGVGAGVGIGIGGVVMLAFVVSLPFLIKRYKRNQRRGAEEPKMQDPVDPSEEYTKLQFTPSPTGRTVASRLPAPPPLTTELDDHEYSYVEEPPIKRTNEYVPMLEIPGQKN